MHLVQLLTRVWKNPWKYPLLLKDMLAAALLGLSYCSLLDCSPATGFSGSLFQDNPDSVKAVEVTASNTWWFWIAWCHLSQAVAYRELSGTELRVEEENLSWQLHKKAAEHGRSAVGKLSSSCCSECLMLFQFKGFPWIVKRVQMTFPSSSVCGRHLKSNRNKACRPRKSN